MAKWLNEQSGDIRARLDIVHAGAGATFNVINHLSHTVDAWSYPIIMIEQVAERSAWEAMDGNGGGPIGKLDLSLNLWLVVHGYTEDVMDDLLSELVGSTRELLNLRHESFWDGGLGFYFHETMPAPSAGYGVTRFGSVFVRAATIPIQVSSITNYPQRQGTE